jgi:taurine dioxygenase
MSAIAPASQAAAAFKVVPSEGPLAADIVGLDLSQPLSDATVQAIHEAWMRHQVLRFREQKLTKDDMLAFSRRFGELDKAPINTKGSPWIQGYPDIAVMSNLQEGGVPLGSLGYGEAVWHTDMSYQEITPTGALLYGIEVTKAGGETGFLSMYQVYDEMPADLRAAIEDKRIKHDASYNSAGELRKGFQPVTDPAAAPGAVHPAVIRHPVTGRKALFLGRRPNAYIMGIPLAESEALLDRVWAHATQSRYAWYQIWQVGDLMIWDNRCTMHRRNAFDPSERRYLLRTQIKGGRPSA